VCHQRGDARGDGAADGDHLQGWHPRVAQRALQRRRGGQPGLRPVQPAEEAHGEHWPAGLAALAFRPALHRAGPDGPEPRPRDRHARAAHAPLPQARRRGRRAHHRERRVDPRGPCRHHGPERRRGGHADLHARRPPGRHRGRRAPRKDRRPHLPVPAQVPLLRQDAHPARALQGGCGCHHAGVRQPPQPGGQQDPAGHRAHARDAHPSLHRARQGAPQPDRHRGVLPGGVVRWRGTRAWR